MREELLGLLAARSGHFLLESGHHGDLWLDLDRMFLRPARVRRLAAELAALLAPHGFSTVCGPLNGGGFLAQAVAVELDAGFSYTERLTAEGSGPRTVEYQLPAALRAGLRGQRVAVVDDVINAGSAVHKTLLELEECGAVPVAVGALLVLGSSAAGLAAERGLPLASITSLPSALWAPRECPLCASGVPLEDLVA